VLWAILTIDTLRLLRLIRTRPSSRALIAAVAALALVLVAGTGSYGVVVTGAARGLLDSVFSGGQIADPIDGRYNILLLGGDAGADRTGLRPDSISVVSIEAATGAATVIGIPRNLEQVPIAADSPLSGPFPDGYDCGDECLISFLYTYGEEHPELYPDALSQGSEPGIEAMRDAVEGVLDLQIQYYVLIDMQGFSDLIDSLGGIDITVPETVQLGKNGNKAIGKIVAGAQHMDGATALWYARTRYNLTDYQRMQHQRLVQEALIAQFEPANVLSKFQAVASAGAQVVKTDIPGGMLPFFVELAEKTRALPITTLELIPDNGVITGNPDYALIRSMVTTALLPSTATPTPTN
jgi:LCP family protein required for cell wall assembly